MSTKTKIQSRIDQTKVKSYFKSWYKRWWGRIVLILIFLAILFSIYFAWMFLNHLSHFNQGDIFDKASGTWVTAEQYQTSQKDAGQLMTEDDPWLGTDQPLIYILAYESFDCPYCKENQADIKLMMAKFSSLVRFIFKDFPTESAFMAHLAANCAQEQEGFWEYHDILFANQGNFSKTELKQYAADLGLDTNQFDACLDSEKYSQEIRQDYAQGVNLDVVGTPSYIVNGQLVPGAINLALWEEIIGFILKLEN